jgi:hypothetical protein
LIRVVDAYAGLSPPGRGYTPLKDRIGNIRNSSVATPDEYKFVKEATEKIMSLPKSHYQITYIWYNPECGKGEDFVTKALNNARIDLASYLKLGGITGLGDTGFELLAFPNLFKKDNPLQFYF